MSQYILNLRNDNEMSIFANLLVQICMVNIKSVRSNTCYVHLVVTPSAAQQLNYRLCPLRSIKGCEDCTIECGGF